ncbi:MAG: hypothetical protein JNL81_07190 [Hyphomonadaceae bacterium]|nr:hypothetical protein [Hyphomonadaceae bacterium]
MNATALTHAMCANRDMRVRRHYRSFSNSASELCFALAAFACGLFDAPVWLTALAAISMLAYWTVTRNSVLNRLRGATWATVMTFGFVVIISIQVGCYWLGLVAGGSI